MPRSSTTSFALAIEPAPVPRLAASALLAHLAAAGSPWLARVPALPAAGLSLLALVGLALTLARIPGPHCALAALVIDGRGCRARLCGSRKFLPAQIGRGSRAYPALIVLDVRAGSRRVGWLLTRDSLPPGLFRRLKARIRLAC